MTTEADTLLKVTDLRVEFAARSGVIHAVSGASFSVAPGETLGIVGESGSGKSVTALSIMGLLPAPAARVTDGSIRYRGRELLDLPASELRSLRGSQIAMVFQDPMTSLNPAMTVGRQIAESLQHHRKLGRRAALLRAQEALSRVGIPDARRRSDDFPHQFSGGMRQRVMIAMALSCEPSLLIADEPTTALDVTIQAQILDLIRTLSSDLNMAVVLITHDMGVVAGMADRVIVMYAGRIVERGPSDELFEDPRHPYTRGLLDSIPRMDRSRSNRLSTIEGSPPDLTALPVGCSFAPRCSIAIERCHAERPELMPTSDVSADHARACWMDLPEAERLAPSGRREVAL